MKKILLLFSILTISFSVIAQEKPTAKEIIKTYLDSLGGEQNLQEVKSVIMEIEGEISGVKFNVLSYRVPDKMKTINKTPSKTLINIYNSGKGIVINDGVKQEMDSLTLIGMKEEVRIFPALYYFTENYKVINNGEKGYEKGYYEIEVESPDGFKSVNYYSIKTGLLYKSIDGHIFSKTYYQEYKTFGKIKIPIKIKLVLGNNQELNFTLIRYEINPEIDDAEFKIEL